MAEILSIVWFYTIYKTERNKRHDFNQKMKQFEEVKRKRLELLLYFFIFIHKD
jgi:hypothetical protein